MPIELTAALLLFVLAGLALTVSMLDGTPTSPTSGLPTVQPIQPARLMDTRSADSTIDGLFAGLGPIPAGSIIELDVAGRADVPDTASAVVLNVTTIAPVDAGYITLFPCGSTLPNASNLNHQAGEIIANAAVVKVGDDGKVCVFTHATTHLAIDINAYALDGAPLRPLDPARLVDTRAADTTIDGNNAGNGPVSADSVMEIDVSGRAGIPDNAAAAVLNIAVVEPTQPGYLTVFPCGEEPPNASTLNHTIGGAVANTVIAAIGTNGRVCIYAYATTHLIVDTSGYIPTDSTVIPISPARFVDTRAADTTIDGLDSGGGPLTAGTTRTITIAGRADIPTNITGVILNITALDSTAPGYLTVYPCDQPQPTASNVNYPYDWVTANAVVAKLSTTGEICVYTSADVHTIIDINGYMTN